MYNGMHLNYCMNMGLLLFLTILGMFGINVSANAIDNNSTKSHNDPIDESGSGDDQEGNFG